MADLRRTAGELDVALQRLRQQWERTAGVWDDQVRRSVEAEYWQPLQQQTQATRAQMDRVGEVIAAAARSVAPPRG